AEDLSDGTSRQTFSVNHSVNSQIAPELVSAREASPIVTQTIQPVIDVALSINPRETRSLQLELNPIELGRVKVEITRDAEGRVSASLVVEQTETAQTLTQNLGHLRESLERAGVVVEQLTVTTAQSLQSQTSQQFGQQFGQQSSQQNASPNHYSDADSLRSDQTGGEEISPASDNKLLSMRA
ncbi:MAG: flagellar hook-length control protein FliK, partial [Blastocatellia bacterium]|nr:flagellar hook-length control protein FliK [Blastocatellia bacterium]